VVTVAPRSTRVAGAIMLGMSLHRPAVISGLQEALRAGAEGPRESAGWARTEVACPLGVASF
jgi:hypothetical protein